MINSAGEEPVTHSRITCLRSGYGLRFLSYPGEMTLQDFTDARRMMPLRAVGAALVRLVSDAGRPVVQKMAGRR
jgi:hypothetical protein